MSLELVLKTCAVMLLAFGIARAIRRASASCRHHVWRVTFVAILLLPIAGTLFTVPVRVLPAPVEPVEPIATFADRGTVAPKSVPACCSAESPAAPNRIEPTDDPTSFDPQAALLAVWATGFLTMAIRIPLGLSKLRTFVRNSARVRGPLRVSLGEEPRSAMALGLRRPIVLLPRASLEWPTARRRMVVAHELAHVRRNDFAGNLLAELACAFYWFNPLVWLGARAMRAEAESAADDEVLASGVLPSDYASELLRMSVDLAHDPRHRVLVGASPMVQHKIEQRMARILAPTARRSGMTTLPTLLILGAGLFLSGGIAALRLAASERRPENEARLAIEKLKRLGIATLSYAVDYDEVLPRAASASELKVMVMPYLSVRTMKSYDSPTKGGQIVFNKAIAGKSLRSLGAPSTVPLWYETLPDASAPAGVVYLDGHTALKGGSAAASSGTLPYRYSLEAVKDANGVVRWILRRNGQVVRDLSANDPLRATNAAVSPPELLEMARSMVARQTPFIGTSIKPLKVVAFFDYECPSCRETDGQTQRLISQNGNAALYYRQFPMPARHPLAVPAATLAIKARDKGIFAFQAIHAGLLEGDRLTQQTIDKVVRKYGLTTTPTARTKAALSEDADLARRLNLTFVPVFVVLEGNSVSILDRKSLTARLTGQH